MGRAQCGGDRWWIYQLLVSSLWLFSTKAKAERLQVSISTSTHNAGTPFRVGRQLQLVCTVDALPAIDVESTGWLHHPLHDAIHFVANRPFSSTTMHSSSHGLASEYLSTSDRYTVYVQPATGTANMVRSVLTINGITEQQLGVYVCEARNPAGMYKRDAVHLMLQDDGSTIKVKTLEASRQAPAPVPPPLPTAGSDTPLLIEELLTPGSLYTNDTVGSSSVYVPATTQATSAAACLGLGYVWTVASVVIGLLTIAA